MARFEINVTELENCSKTYDLPIDAAWLDESLGIDDLRADGEGRLTITASMSGTDVVVHGGLRAGVTAPCSRCLSPAHLAIDTPMTVLFSRKSATLPAELELTPEDLDRVTYSGDVVELDEIVRDHVLLEVPMQLLCREDCVGIEVPATIRGPRSLVDAPEVDGKAIDPRLAPLLALREAAMKPPGDAPPSASPKKRRND